MLPVVERSGRSTAEAIVFYSLALLAATLAPTLFGMTGYVYFFSALGLGVWVLIVGLRIWRARLDPGKPEAKVMARNLLKATVFYLPFVKQPISSTEIRGDCKKGEQVSQQLPPLVWSYIERNKLYS